MSDTGACARCGGDCRMTSCKECGGCENTGVQPYPACQAVGYEIECDICDNPGICDCDDPNDCSGCYGSGSYVPEHCCLCGGSPYCDCCRKCGQCIGTCKCPVEVQMSDGSTKTL